MRFSSSIFLLTLLWAFLSCDEPQGMAPDVQEPSQDTEDILPPSHEDEESSKDYEMLDFSYAGFMRSECAPPDASLTGYTVVDVTNFGAVPNDGKSDREAFLNAIARATGQNYTIDNNGWIVFNHKEKANAVIYFPEGEYILHTKDDDVNGVSRSIQIRSGNLIIRGAGRDKTTLIMADPNQPKDVSQLYSSPDMIQIKHNSTHASFSPSVIAAEGIVKGSHKVKVNTTAPLSSGDWVCLYLKNTSPELISAQVAPYQAQAHWAIVKSGVEIIDYHQIKSISNNEITFHAPLMYDIPEGYEVEIRTYPHYSNVGVEDLTFRGYAKSDFTHHGTWQDDGAYKPISFNRLTDSWIRRVAFVSTSEACSIINSANVSAYDIEFRGNRGHSSVRSQSSSRVLIAGTDDLTSDGLGNFHGVGVSRQSVGTVLYKNCWGDDSCFESHATQPRATLIDCCKGGWHRGHQGGDSDQVPHHLSDLVIWNFYATSASDSGNFMWWDDSVTWWKFLPPYIGGFKPEGMVNFAEGQYIKMDIGDVESLFTKQLSERLGGLPTWITEIDYKQQ